MILTLLVALLAVFSPVLPQDVVNGGPSTVAPHGLSGGLNTDGVSSGGPTGSPLPVRIPAPSDTYSGGPTG